MDSEFFRQRAVLARDLAENADPFTKKRLLDPAERYDAGGAWPRTFASFARYRAIHAFCARMALIDRGRRGMKKSNPDAAAIEVKCDACGGTGYPPVKEISPGRRTYPAPCKVCGGKGRLSKS